jgi:energy-coupling factor transporter ATP-binding protein EcfA2
LSILPGELVAVVGANGSGKSTLVRLANGTLLPSEGTVEVEGMTTVVAATGTSSGPSGIHAIRRMVGVVFQHPDDQIVATSVEEDVAFGPENLGLPREAIRQRVDSALKTVGLAGLESREPHVLSGGQKQRAVIARALINNPKVIFADEPTGNLDSVTGRMVEDILFTLNKDKGITLIVVTHDVELAARCDRQIFIRDGLQDVTRDAGARS